MRLIFLKFILLVSIASFIRKRKTIHSFASYSTTYVIRISWISLVINTGSLKSIRHNGDDKKDVSVFQ